MNSVDLSAICNNIFAVNFKYVFKIHCKYRRKLKKIFNCIKTVAVTVFFLRSKTVRKF